MTVKREQVVKVAEKFVAKGRIDSAIKEYLKVLKENPNDVSTLNRLGDLYARISRIDEAVRLFAQIAAQYTEDGFLVKAIAIYKKIIKLDPTRLQVYESLAALYHKQGLVNEARTQYQVLGDYYLKHHDNAAAINIFVKMVELEPDNPSHHLKLAELYQQGQLWDKALKSYRTIAELMLHHGRVEEAVRVYQRAIEVYPEDLGFITDAVLGIKDAGHTGPAAKLLASAVAANPQAEKVARLAGLRTGDATEQMPAMPRPRPSGDGRETLPPPAAPPSIRPSAAASAPVAPARPVEPPRPTPPPPEPEPEESEEDFFVLDIDEPSEHTGSLVAPPADMDGTGTAFQRPLERKPPPAQPPAEEPAAADWRSERDSGFSFEMPDLEMPDMEIGELGAAEAAPAEAVQPELEEESLELPWDEPLPPLAGEERLAGGIAEGVEEESVEMELDLSQLELEPAAADALHVPTEQLAGDQGLTEVGDEVGFELELEEPEAGWAEPAALATPAPAPRAAVPPPAPSPPAAAPAPPEEPRVQDLLAEAEVFAKYNLEEKALERLDQVLGREPHNLDALQLLVDLQIRGGDAARVESAVRRLRPAVEAKKATDIWERVQAKLSRAGMTLSGETVAPIRTAPDRVSQLIKALERPTPAPAPTAPKKPEAPPKADKKKAAVDDALAAIAAGFQRPAKAKPAAPAPPPAVPPRPAAPPAAAAPPAPSAPVVPFTPPPAAPAPARPAVAAGPAPAPPAAATPPAAAPHAPVVLPPLVPSAPVSPAPARPAAPPPSGHYDAEGFEDELPDIVLPEERHPSTMPDLDDTGMDWLREEPKAAAAASPDKLFDDEDEFFDLAAELEEELGVEEGKIGGEILAQSEEPTLEEIVEGFKKGVAENLSPEDYDTHYNLGIAYREMGLLDEAIGEFQLASKDPIHLVDCCSMLGVSFLEKGLPELAVKWYQRGLTAPDLREEVTLSLLYDMGNVYLQMGDEAAARKTFVELYGINSNYRDVVAKLAELRALD